MIRTRFFSVIGAGIVALLFANVVHADATYPNKPVRVIVPFATGGGADVIARLVFAKLSTQMGQPFVIENRGSAGGIVGTAAVAKAAPDGYTLLLGQTGPNAINPALFESVPYDPVADFDPVIQLTSYPYVIVVHPDVPATTLKELTDLAKAKPNTLTYGTAGIGSSGQLAAELFMRTTGTKFSHIPYRGAGPALSDTMAGVINLTFGDMASSTPQVTAGNLRAIAVTGDKRTFLLPSVPTVAESGYPGFEALAWHGVYAPANTPKAIVDKLNSELAKVLAQDDVRDRLLNDGIEPIGANPQAFADYTLEEIEKWGTIVRDAGIRLQQED